MAVDIAKCPQGANQGYYAGLFPKWDHFGVIQFWISVSLVCVSYPLLPSPVPSSVLLLLSPFLLS